MRFALPLVAPVCVWLSVEQFAFASVGEPLAVAQSGGSSVRAGLERQEGCLDPVDSDGDQMPDCRDSCPNDANKVLPGVCGCGAADADTDGDGVADCHEQCPLDPFKRDPGVCGCGVNDFDGDGDGFADECEDACPDDPGKQVPGKCGCGSRDVDGDGDGVVDCIDNCESVSNPSQADANGDGVGDACAFSSASVPGTGIEPLPILSPEAVVEAFESGTACCGFGVAPAMVAAFWFLCAARTIGTGRKDA